MRSRSSPVRSTWLSLRSASVKTSLATVMQSNRFAGGMFLVQLISGENDDVDGAAGFAPGNSSVVMGSFNYRLERPRASEWVTFRAVSWRGARHSSLRTRSRIVLQPMPLSERIRSPVFMVGAPRSGTTLLRVTLNHHSQLAVCSETDYFQRVYARRSAFGDPSNPRNRDRIAGLRERLMSEGISWSALFSSMIQAYADSHGPHLALVQHCGVHGVHP